MKTFPNYDQLYTIVEAIVNAISRKKADLVPNELTREEMEHLYDLWPIVFTETVYGFADYDPWLYQYIGPGYFDSDNLLYISRVEYSDEDVEDSDDVTSWHVWDPETESLEGYNHLRLTLIGDKGYISANPDTVDEFVTSFRDQICPPR
jgi:hypothetical protein